MRNNDGLSTATMDAMSVMYRRALVAVQIGLERRTEPIRAIHSGHLRGLRLWLVGHQGSVCAGCGETFRDSVELCHIRASSAKGTGYEIIGGNVYAGCKPCNNYDRGKSAMEVINSLARPDLVAFIHPSRTECVALAESGGVRHVARTRDAIAELATD